MSVVSYRALKKLIGETSLERKCRFLFGAALGLLITASLWWHASRTRDLVNNQQENAARRLVPQILRLHHYQKILDPAIPAVLAGSEDAAAFRQTFGGGNEPAADVNLPIWQLISATELGSHVSTIEAKKQFDLDDTLTEWSHYVVVDGQRRLQFFSPIRLTRGCLVCHGKDSLAVSADVSEAIATFNAATRTAAVPADLSTASEQAPADAELVSQVPAPGNSELPLFAIAAIDMPLGEVDQQLARNWAMLVASGIVTAFLAMLAAYVIVRYVIVKPVQHLKDVSDAIARGTLNLRAEISTGDEFEELSQAFNRMLRYMNAKSDELRGVNERLDGKIDQLARANMELFNNNRLKDDFLATISHELRTPLNSILGFSDILQSAPNLDDRQRRYVTNIQTSGQSLMVQINDLLDLAKIESGKMEIHPTSFALSDVLELQVQQMMPLADRRNIDLRTDPPPVPVSPLFQDRGKISQIVNNLLSNAIKFTPEGGRIRVSWRAVERGFLSFSVEDTGIGIPLQEQEHIFEKFRQGSTLPEGRDHTKREYEGTGLGLSIVRELSRLLGGEVGLKSEFGRGSIFSVRIPLEVPLRTDTVNAEATAGTVQAPPLITATDIRIPAKADAGTVDVRLDVQTIGG
ncbi:MAG: ATP-binding protein [Planctomyces sp.]